MDITAIDPDFSKNSLLEELRFPDFVSIFFISFLCRYIFTNEIKSNCGLKMFKKRLKVLSIKNLL
jgi:hypothetical protein